MMAEAFQHRSKTHRATILLAPEGDGWTYAVSVQRLFGDFCGHGEALGRPGAVSARRLASTRAAALTAAKAQVLYYVPDRPLSDWLASLDVPAPSQPDLFQGPDQ